MEQGLSDIGIIGAGPAGCCCAYFLVNNKNCSNVRITLFDYNEPLRTILPTGGGRCNLAFSEFDFKELAKNYPRGEKFLYSIFSQFSTSDTLEMFESLGIKTYTQPDGRIFPTSDNSKEVREKFLEKLKSVKTVREKVLRIEKHEKFKVITDMNCYYFDKIVFATGGHHGYDIVKRLGVSIIEPKPSLVGLVTEDEFKPVMGTVVHKVKNNDTGEVGDVLFTHFGISGPLVYKISSIYSRKNLPYSLSFDLADDLEDFQQILNANPHKFIKNILSEILPARFGEFILTDTGVSLETKAHSIDGKTRDRILDKIHNFKVVIKSTQKDGETVTSGGIDLNKINPKTMESKEVEGLYFCGEVVDIDGFCGGFNLQNCWSTAYVTAKNL